MIRSAPVVAAVLTVATAGWAGLARVGLLPSPPLAGPSTWHGALMVTAIATFIAVERAAVIRRPWVWAAPVISAAGAILLIAGADNAGALLIAASAAIIVVAMARGAAATPGIAIVLMTAGAAAWLVAALLLVTAQPLVRIVPWWSAFLVLTIAGERHELAHILRPSRRALITFAFPVVLLAIGTTLTLVDLRAGAYALGIGDIGIALWLVARDRPLAASRTHPLARFIGRTTRAAYLWLAVAGLLTVLVDVPAGLLYDAELHALFVGFVLTMIFAHAPIVLPAILGGMVEFRAVIYAPLALLTLSVAVRVASDVAGDADGRALGAAGIGIALPLFAAVMASSFRARRVQARPHDRHTDQSAAGGPLAS